MAYQEYVFEVDAKTDAEAEQIALEKAADSDWNLLSGVDVRYQVEMVEK